MSWQARRRRRTHLTAAVLLALASAVTTSCHGGGDAAQDSPMTSVLQLDFDKAHINGDQVAVSNPGHLDVQVQVATAAGGTAVIAPRSPDHNVLRLPRISDAPAPPRAVLLVSPDSAVKSSESLDPGNHDFRYGATFSLDRRSEGVGSDNGNNVMQRGLSGDPTQYKLQVDHGHASCRVAGVEGSVQVKSRSSVQPGEWYTATCSRVGRKLSLVLRRAGSTQAVSSSGDTGSVTAPSGTPLTIGGKAYDGHVIAGNSDQFNGEIGRVFLDVRLPGAD
jgi:hypothetical protein